MGASGNDFIHFRMEEEHYRELDEQLRSNLDVYRVEVVNVDYSHDELWSSLKKESTKKYKELKNREYDLRHNVK